MTAVPDSFSDLCLYREALRMNEDEWLPVEFTEGALLYLRKLGHDLWADTTPTDMLLAVIQQHRRFLRKVAASVLPPDYFDVADEVSANLERLRSENTRELLKSNLGGVRTLRCQQMVEKRKLFPFLNQTYRIDPVHIDGVLKEITAQ